MAAPDQDRPEDAAVSDEAGAYGDPEFHERAMQLLQGFNRPPRDAARIFPFLEEFGRLWERYPDMRFGQMIQWVSEREDTFYWEEDRWLERIRETANRGS